MGVRAERTIAALRNAALKRAETQEVSELTASQVAQSAGINRVTFYNHASSLAQLLVDALRVELDGIRQRYRFQARTRRHLRGIGQQTKRSA